MDLDAETQEWHHNRLAKLKADDGWLTLIGLHWLKEGREQVFFEIPALPPPVLLEWSHWQH